MSKRTRKSLNLLLAGGAGRMGLEIQALVAQDPAFRVTGQINSTGRWREIDAGSVDVVIDFSTRKGLAGALKWCERERKPLVSGTTGLTGADRARLRQAAGRIPILYSANMSLGVATLMRAIQALSVLKDWDFQIEEIHHRHKKDRPSGTALLLQAELIKEIGRRPPAPLSLRGGSVPGQHTVWAMGQDEILTFQHTALDRRVFARGALVAARRLIDKKQPGLYDLTDLYFPK